MCGRRFLSLCRGVGALCRWDWPGLGLSSGSVVSVASLCHRDWWAARPVGCVWCRCAPGNVGRRVLWVVRSVAVPWGLVECVVFWVHMVSLCHWDWWSAHRVGCMWRRCAVGIGGGGVLLAASGVAVPWGFVGSTSFGRCEAWRRDWWGARRFWGVWCRCAVGLAGRRVVLGVSGVVIVLGFAIVSRRVVSCHVMSLTESLTRVPHRHRVTLGVRSEIMLCHVVVILCHVMSCDIMSCHVTACYVLSLRRVVDTSRVPLVRLPTSRLRSCRVAASHVASCRVISCHVTSCDIMSCHVLSCPVGSSSRVPRLESL